MSCCTQTSDRGGLRPWLAFIADGLCEGDLHPMRAATSRPRPGPLHSFGTCRMFSLVLEAGVIIKGKKAGPPATKLCRLRYTPASTNRAAISTNSLPLRSSFELPPLSAGESRSPLLFSAVRPSIQSEFTVPCTAPGVACLFCTRRLFYRCCHCPLAASPCLQPALSRLYCRFQGAQCPCDAPCSAGAHCPVWRPGLASA